MFILECTDTVQFCYNARKIFVLIKTLIKFLQWSVPIILVLLGSINIFKAVVRASDDKVVEEAKKTFIKRLTLGVIIFLVPFFITLIFEVVEKNIVSGTGDGISSTSWIGCWNNVDKKKDSAEYKEYFNGCENIYEITDKGNGETNQNGNNQQSDNTNKGNVCYVYYRYICKVGKSVLNDEYLGDPHCINEFLVNGKYTTSNWPKNGNFNNEFEHDNCLTTCSNSSIKTIGVFGRTTGSGSNKKYYCVCAYDVEKTITGSDTKPDINKVGEFDTYNCPVQRNCYNQWSSCTLQGEKKVK